MTTRRRLRTLSNTSIRNLSVQFIFNVRADNVIECGFGPEPELVSPFRMESLGPAGDDSLDELIRRPTDSRGNFVAGDATQRLDLLSDCARYRSEEHTSELQS